MSFLSQHIALQNDTHDPVVGPNSPHYNEATKGKAHYKGHPDTPETRVVMDDKRAKKSRRRNK